MANQLTMFGVKPLMSLKNLGSTGRRWMSVGDKSGKTCLHDFHVQRGARMELFAGYSMPIVYKNQTMKQEHMHTRQSASVFDVSHMMQVTIRGSDTCNLLEFFSVADVDGMPTNKSTLSVFLNETGGIIDDCIISKRSDYVHLVSNAGNAEEVWSWINSHHGKRFDVKIERLTGRGLIALQGPKAGKVLESLLRQDLSKVGFMNVIDANFGEAGRCQIARCGYTGEDGFEISVDSDKAQLLMNLLCDQDEVQPAGLGARDTLRLEAGLCLHGHDITKETTPIEAGLTWTIHKRRRKEKNFIGAQVVLDQLVEGAKRKRVGLVSLSRGPPAREGTQILDSTGTEVGLVTSGTHSPVLETNIAMGYLPASMAGQVGQVVNCVIRGKSYEYRIAKMPFVPAKYFTIPK